MAEWLATLPLSITFMPPLCPEHQLPMRLIGSGRKFHWECRDDLCPMRASFTGDIPQCPIHRQTLHLRGSGLHKMLVCPSAKKEHCPVQVAVNIEKIFPSAANSSGLALPLHATEAIALEGRPSDGMIQQRLEGLGVSIPIPKATGQQSSKLAKNKIHTTEMSLKAAFLTHGTASVVAVDMTTIESEDDDEVAEWLRTKSGKSTYTVAKVTRLIQSTFNEHPVLGRSIVVEGELSNVKRSSRGHIYFTLKDGESSIGGILWAGVANRLNFDLKDGQAVYLTGKLEIYSRSGTYSLVASKLEPVGIGALQLAFEQIKARLEAEGLFMEDFKKPLPDFPQRIGLVTSSTGAVIHDMLRVIRRKNNFLDVLLFPVKVQGEGAAAEIAAAITELNNPGYELDALIVARGGGSFEDLFCFSEEAVVRAVFNSRLPIVTGIGHEPDFSLADAASDYSASTPTAAADWLTPDAQQMLGMLTQRFREMAQGVIAHLQYYERSLDDDSTRLIEQHERLVENAETRLSLAQQHLLSRADSYFLRQVERLGHLGANLNAFNPLTTLERGFAFASSAPPGGAVVIHSVQQLQEGEEFFLRLSDGRLRAKVLSREALPAIVTTSSELSLDIVSQPNTEA